MKIGFTKNICGITVFLLFLLSANLLHAQLNCTTFNSIISGSFEIQTPSANLTLSITSQNGGVGPGNQSALLIRKSSVFCLSLLGPNTTDFSFINSSVDYVFQNTPTSKLFKAQAGVPFSITLNAFSSNPSYSLRNSQIDFQNNPSRRSSFTGSETFNGQTNRNFSILPNDFNIPSSNVYTIPNIIFSKGSTRGYVILNLEFTSPGGGFGIPSEHFSIILPFVVEGPYDIVVDSLGVTTEPQIPYMVIHKPPGDASFSQITNTTKTCRNFDESFSTDETNTTKASVKIGTKGSLGLVFETSFEIYAQLSGSIQNSKMELRTKSNQTCVEVTNTWSTSDLSTATQNGSDVFLGYGMDMAYGKGRYISILPNNTIKDDTTIIFSPILPIRQFALTKDGILSDIDSKTLIVNNINLNNKARATAQYQINVWNQVLFKNDSTIAAANIPIGTPINFSAGSEGSSTSTLEYSANHTLQVGHYIENTISIEALVDIGGSGFSAGHEFLTRKSFGSAIGEGTTTTNSISYTLKDNDAGDIFYVNKYKDPIYGTPIFKAVAGTRSSCPYEGGYQRDQPRLEIVGSSQNNITIPNVTLGTPASFQIKLCNNNITEDRTYNLGFVPQTNLNDLLISAAGSTGSQFGPFTVPANSCKVQNYDVNIARRFPSSDVNFSNLELEFFAACEPSIKSSIIANVSFAAPPVAVVNANNTAICSGSPATLTATCPVNYTTNWYTSFTGGFVVASGSSVSLSPTDNTVYYVGCESTNHVPPRVASKLVLVGTPSTVLNLTTDFATSSLQIANTTITASNKIFSPASVTYKAGNSLTFSPGFEAKSGSNFMARIGGCGN